MLHRARGTWAALAFGSTVTVGLVFGTVCSVDRAGLSNGDASVSSGGSGGGLLSTGRQRSAGSEPVDAGGRVAAAAAAADRSGRTGGVGSQAGGDSGAGQGGGAGRRPAGPVALGRRGAAATVARRAPAARAATGGVGGRGGATGDGGPTGTGGATGRTARRNWRGRRRRRERSRRRERRGRRDRHRRRPGTGGGAAATGGAGGTGGSHPPSCSPFPTGLLVHDADRRAPALLLDPQRRNRLDQLREPLCERRWDAGDDSVVAGEHVRPPGSSAGEPLQGGRRVAGRHRRKSQRRQERRWTVRLGDGRAMGLTSTGTSGQPDGSCTCQGPGSTSCSCDHWLAMLNDGTWYDRAASIARPVHLRSRRSLSGRAARLGAALAALGVAGAGCAKPLAFDPAAIAVAPDARRRAAGFPARRRDLRLPD